MISKFYAGSSLQIRRISADLWMLLKRSYYGVRKICRGTIRRVENSPLEKFAAGKLASGKICHWENSLRDILGLRPLTPDRPPPLSILVTPPPPQNLFSRRFRWFQAKKNELIIFIINFFNDLVKLGNLFKLGDLVKLGNLLKLGDLLKLGELVKLCELQTSFRPAGYRIIRLGSS